MLTFQTLLYRNDTVRYSANALRPFLSVQAQNFSLRLIPKADDADFLRLSGR